MISKRHRFKAILDPFYTVLECKRKKKCCTLKTYGNLRRTELSDNFDHGIRPKYACKGHGLVTFIIGRRRFKPFVNTQPPLIVKAHCIKWLMQTQSSRKPEAAKKCLKLLISAV